MTHWHLAYGLAGYGPDGSDGFDTATEIRGLGGLADQISEKLKESSGQSWETAHVHGTEPADYKAAWLEILRSEELDTLSATFSHERETAPLYVDNPEVFETEILRLVDTTFPKDVSDNTRLCVWACTTEDCEHLNDSED